MDYFYRCCPQCWLCIIIVDVVVDEFFIFNRWCCWILFLDVEMTNLMNLTSVDSLVVFDLYRCVMLMCSLYSTSVDVLVVLDLSRCTCCTWPLSMCSVDALVVLDLCRCTCCTWPFSMCFVHALVKVDLYRWTCCNWPLSMYLLYLTSLDVLVVLDLSQCTCCTWPLSMYLLYLTSFDVFAVFDLSHSLDRCPKVGVAHLVCPRWCSQSTCCLCILCYRCPWLTHCFIIDVLDELNVYCALSMCVLSMSPPSLRWNIVNTVQIKFCCWFQSFYCWSWCLWQQCWTICKPSSWWKLTATNCWWKLLCWTMWSMLIADKNSTQNLFCSMRNVFLVNVHVEDGCCSLCPFWCLWCCCIHTLRYKFWCQKMVPYIDVEFVFVDVVVQFVFFIDVVVQFMFFNWCCWSIPDVAPPEFKSSCWNDAQKSKMHKILSRCSWCGCQWENLLLVAAERLAGIAPETCWWKISS